MATSEKQPPKPVTLSDDDRIRMRRLYEEIAGRLREVGLIMERTLGRKLKMGHGESRLSTRPEDSIDAAAAARGKDHILICHDGGCWEDPPGICYPDPDA